MAITLPTERRPIQQYNPRLLVLFGKPKSGKSTLMASLENNLIIDLEDGYKALSVMSVVAKDAYALFDVKKALVEAMEKNEGKYPYKFITIDNATRLEEMALPYAAAMYRKTTMGASWGFLKDPTTGLPKKDKNGKNIVDPNADVRLLPQGAGYLYLRKAVRELIDMFKPFCETLILVAHVKDRQIKVSLAA